MARGEVLTHAAPQTMYSDVYLSMVRKQVYIEEAQEAFLKRRAKELGVSEAELIRRGIERLQQAPTLAPFDHVSWQETLAFLTERPNLAAPIGPARWTREDAYEERLARIPG
jgi:hypothetical protein